MVPRGNACLVLLRAADGRFPARSQIFFRCRSRERKEKNPFIARALSRCGFGGFPSHREYFEKKSENGKSTRNKMARATRSSLVRFGTMRSFSPDIDNDDDNDDMIDLRCDESLSSDSFTTEEYDLKAEKFR